MSKLSSIFLCLALLLASCQFAFADKVILKNGDRLTGKVLRKEGDAIVVQTEAMGAVKVRWSAIEQIVSDEPLALTLADGQIVKGTIESGPEKISVAVSEKEKITVEQKAVKAVRTPEEQDKFEAEQERLRNRKITDFWSGTLDVGFSLTAGNSDTRTFSGGFRGARETPVNKFTIYANALQVRNTSTGIVRITAQSVWWGARYDADINGKWFAFSSGDFEYNKPQKLDIRAVLGGGVGYHALRNDRTTLDFTIGGTNNYENFSTGLTRNSAELLFGEDLKLRINKRARFNNRLVFYPNLSRIGNFRALLDASLQTDLNSWLGWHVTVGNRYNSRPVSATEKNDFLMSTGLRVSFGKNRRK